MSEIKQYPVLTHLRSEPNVHVIRYRKGKRVASGKGLAFWFTRLGSSIAEVPTDDRELQFLFHGRSGDFQSITIQGELSYRVTDAERLAERIDFSIDLVNGLHRKQPLEQLATCGHRGVPMQRMPGKRLLKRGCTPRMRTTRHRYSRWTHGVDPHPHLVHEAAVSSQSFLVRGMDSPPQTLPTSANRAIRRRPWSPSLRRPTQRLWTRPRTPSR